MLAPVRSTSPSPFPIPSPLPPPPLNNPLNNRLQLSRIPNRILNNLATRHQNLLLRPLSLPLLREIYPSILDDPAALLRESDDAAFAVEEE